MIKRCDIPPVSYTHLDVYKRQEKYYRMVINLYKEVLLINRVNPDRVLDAQREISNAITTAIITNAVSYTHLDVYKRQVFTTPICAVVLKQSFQLLTCTFLIHIILPTIRRAESLCEVRAWQQQL